MDVVRYGWNQHQESPSNVFFEFTFLINLCPRTLEIASSRAPQSISLNSLPRNPRCSVEGALSTRQPLIDYPHPSLVAAPTTDTKASKAIRTSDAEVNHAEGRHTRPLLRLVVLQRHRARLLAIVIIAASHALCRLKHFLRCPGGSSSIVRRIRVGLSGVWYRIWKRRAGLVLWLLVKGELDCWSSVDVTSGLFWEVPV